MTHVQKNAHNCAVLYGWKSLKNIITNIDTSQLPNQIQRNCKYKYNLMANTNTKNTKIEIYFSNMKCTGSELPSGGRKMQVLQM